MIHLAVKIPVVESESGWGRKIDDYMVCLTVEDAKEFEKEFNSKNTSEIAPSYYMQVEGEPEPIDLSEKQYLQLKLQKRVWLTTLKKIK